MDDSHGMGERASTSIWYFVGATFLFVAPSLFFPEADPWVPFAFIAAGLLAVTCGGMQLGREIAHRRGQKNSPPPEVD